MVQNSAVVSRMLKRKVAVRVILGVIAFAVDLFFWQGILLTHQGFELSFWVVPAVLIVAYLLLLAQPRVWLGYVAFLLVSLLGLMVISVVGIIGSFLSLFLVARQSTTRIAALALAGMILPISIASYNSATFGEETEDAISLFAWNFGLWSLIAVLCFVAARSLRRTENRLHTERRWAKDALEEARTSERLRISRDLHDSVAHSMTAVVLQVAGVRAILKKGAEFEKVDPVLADIQTTAEQSMRELHRLLGMLRNEEETQVGQAYSFQDIGALISSAHESGIDVISTANGEVRSLDPSISHAAYRTVQEGLSNAMKHGGDGCRVELATHWSHTELTISITTISGVINRPPVSGGFGLMGLRERISVSGGSLRHGQTPGGYLLKVVLPVDTSDSSVQPAEQSIQQPGPKDAP